MTTAAIPKQFVDGPPRVPSPYGLFSVLTVRQPGDQHWQMGVEWESESCAGVGGFGPLLDCDVPPSGLPREEGDNAGPVLGDATPFTVYAEYSCSPVGRSLADMQRLATLRLQAREESGAERFLWTGELGNTPVIADSDAEVLSAVPATPVTALALLEKFAGDAWGGQGVVHVSKLGAVVLTQNGVIKESGSKLVTNMGTPVIAGNGYPGTGPGNTDPEDGTSWAYITPPLIGYRGDIETDSGRQGDLLDRGTNDMTVLAERTYLIGFDPCGIGAVNFQLPKPPTTAAA